MNLQKINSEILKNELIKLLDEKKCEEIVWHDLRNTSERLSDFIIIASGTSSRHAEAVADYLYRHLKTLRFKPHIEGTAQSGWVMLDANGIEIHLFKPELRAYYDLERIISESSEHVQDIA